MAVIVMMYATNACGFEQAGWLAWNPRASAAAEPSSMWGVPAPVLLSSTPEAQPPKKFFWDLRFLVSRKRPGGGAPGSASRTHAPTWLGRFHG